MLTSVSVTPDSTCLSSSEPSFSAQEMNTPAMERVLVSDLTLSLDACRVELAEGLVEPLLGLCLGGQLLGAGDDGIHRIAGAGSAREGRGAPDFEGGQARVLPRIPPQIRERPILLVLLAVQLHGVLEELQHLLDLEAEAGALELQLVDCLLDLGGALERVVRQALARVPRLRDLSWACGWHGRGGGGHRHGRRRRPGSALPGQQL